MTTHIEFESHFKLAQQQQAKHDDGSYIDPITQARWEGWQAQEPRIEGYRLSSVEQWRRKKEWQARCNDMYRYVSMVPDGYKLVPIEPTPEMIEAAERDRTYYGNVAANHYRAMLAAVS